MIIRMFLEFTVPGHGDSGSYVSDEAAAAVAKRTAKATMASLVASTRPTSNWRPRVFGARRMHSNADVPGVAQVIVKHMDEASSDAAITEARTRTAAALQAASAHLPPELRDELVGAVDALAYPLTGVHLVV